MNELVSTSYKMGSISLDTSQPQVGISIPDISFPMSPIPGPLSGIGKTPTGASGQVAGKTMPLSKIKAKKLAIYNVKLNDDKCDCSIFGMVITNGGRRLLADYDNHKIKLFSRDMKLLCSLSLSTAPRDIAFTGDREAVVCCNEPKLLILDISDRKMSIKGTVELPFRVVGIAPYQDKLLVTTPCSDSVKLIDQRGRVYWSTRTGQQGQRSLSAPWNVTCYDDGGSAAVIVSDLYNHTLTVLNADTGDVITRRQIKGKKPEVCYHRHDR